MVARWYHSAGVGCERAGRLLLGVSHKRRLSAAPPILVRVLRITVKTLGELEAAICEGISRFEQNYMGRGPKDVHTYLLGDLIVVGLRGVLTAAEQHLVTSLPAGKGRDLLKQVRTHLIETARPVMEKMVQEVTAVGVLSLHHDISTVTGEEIVVFKLAERPDFRETRRR